MPIINILIYQKVGLADCERALHLWCMRGMPAPRECTRNPADPRFLSELETRGRAAQGFAMAGLQPNGLFGLITSYPAAESNGHGKCAADETTNQSTKPPNNGGKWRAIRQQAMELLAIRLCPTQSSRDASFTLNIKLEQI